VKRVRASLNSLAEGEKKVEILKGYTVIGVCSCEDDGRIG
jgi:hypothetical protein